jgi:hypothetical protein
VNLLSEHNRILRVGEGGSQEYFPGPNINITDHVISGKYWDNEINSAISSTSGDIVNEAFNQSTAWVDEQGYLTAHQDVSNLPYVQNSALGYNGNLISSISGDGFFAESANNSYHADDADHATYADSATHADSADFVATANFANSASSALNAEIANVAYTALTANFLDGGWELDVDGFITAYNNSAFAGAGGGRYEGIEPIVVNNDEMKISAKSALLGVQSPLYFVEDSETATIIGISGGTGVEYSGIAPIVVDNENHLISAESAKLGVQGPLYFVEDTPSSTVIGIDNSAFPTFETNSEGEVSSINGSAIYASNVVEYSAGTNIDITDHVISVTGSVASADRADYAVSATSSHYSHSAIEAASADSATYDNLGREITATYLTAVTGDNTPYSAGANIDITNHVVSGKDWTSEIQDASANAVNEAINTITAVEFANSASALTTSAGWDVTEYSAGANIDITNHVVSGKDWSDEITAATDGVMLTSGLEYDSDNFITGYSGSAFAGQGGIEYEGIAPIIVNNVEHKISAQSAKLGVQEPLYFVEDSISATVIGISGLPEVEGVMYESALGKSDNKITGYNGTAFSTGSTYDVKASANISVSTAGNTFTVSGKDWMDIINDAANFSYTQATANASGKYIPYTNITTGISGTTVYNVASGIRVTAASGWTEMYNQNKENSNEAHLQVAQNYTGNKSFWAELDGAGGGILQMNWNSGTIVPNANSSYADGTTASLDIVNGAIVYRTAAHSLTATGEGGDGENKIWQIGSERVRFWNQWGTASFGPLGMEIYDSAGNNRWYTTAADGATRFRIQGSGQNSAGIAITGAVDLTPAYINFYDQSWNVRATLNYEEINALKALLNHVQTASASWVNPSTATGSI